MSDKDKREVLPLEYKVTVRALEPQGNLLAYADILVNGILKIVDYKVLSGANGLFISNPSRKRNDGDEYYDICFMVNAEERERLSETIIEAYVGELERMRRILGVTDGGASVQPDNEPDDDDGDSD